MVGDRIIYIYEYSISDQPTIYIYTYEILSLKFQSEPVQAENQPESGNLARDLRIARADFAQTIKFSLKEATKRCIQGSCQDQKLVDTWSKSKHSHAYKGGASRHGAKGVSNQVQHHHIIFRAHS